MLSEVEAKCFMFFMLTSPTVYGIHKAFIFLPYLGVNSLQIIFKNCKPDAEHSRRITLNMCNLYNT
jgi:hypothetical protein